MRADLRPSAEARPASDHQRLEAVSREAFQNFCRTRHFALREGDYFRTNGPPRSKADAYFPRFVGTRHVSPVCNNSERMRGVLQPDPWSAATGDSLRKTKMEGTGRLFATHTASQHSSTLVWPGAVQHPHSEGQSQDDGRTMDDVSPTATPRRLTKREIAYEAAKALPQRPVSSSLTARARFGRGATLNAVREEHKLPKPTEVRGKYTG